MKRFAEIHDSFLSPLVLFPIAWLAAALLSQLRLLGVQTAWSSTMTLVVLVVPVAFFVGGLIGHALAFLVRPGSLRILVRPQRRILRIALAVFVLIGFAELFHQFIKIGGIPLLASDGNEIRFDQGGPTIVLVNLLTVAGLVAFTRPSNLLAPDSRFELSVVVLSMVGFLLQAGRGSLALMVIAGVLARWLYWGRPKPWLIFGAGATAFVILTLGFYLRTRHTPYLPFEAELFSQLLPGMPLFLKPFIPAYIAITTNFYALQQVVAEFPDALAFGWGAYSGIGLDLFIPGTLDLNQVSSSLSPPWITSTIAGSLWADGGFPVVVIGSAMSGLLSVGGFTMARRTHTLGWCLVGAYLLYTAMFGIYTNLWTQQIDWLMVAPLLLALGTLAESQTAESGSRKRERPESVQTRTWILMGASALAGIVFLGLSTNRLLPKPLPIVESGTMPRSMQSVESAMTDGDAQDGAVYWITRRSRTRLVLTSRLPSGPGHGTPRLSFSSQATDSEFDVGRSPFGAGQALFEFIQRKNSVLLQVRRFSHARVKKRSYRIPIGAPRGREVRQYAVATWRGSKPDVFAISRYPGCPTIRIEVFAGESGFRQTSFKRASRLTASDPERWSIDVGRIGGSKPDLLLIRHWASNRNVEVRLVPGSEDFRSISYQRDIDLRSARGLDSEYLIGRHYGEPALYSIRPSRPLREIETFDLGEILTLPAGVR